MAILPLVRKLWTKARHVESRIRWRTHRVCHDPTKGEASTRDPATPGNGTPSLSATAADGKESEITVRFQKASRGRYVPQTSRNASQTSPTVARARSASRIG